MTIDRNSFIRQFIEETEENLQEIERETIRFRKDPANEECLGQILRKLHSVKGSARMMGFSVVESLAHGLESLLKGVREERYPVDEKLLGLFLHGTTRAAEALRRIGSSGDDGIDCRETVAVIERAAAGEEYRLPDTGGTSGTSPAGLLAADDDDSFDTSGNGTVRVRTAQIDRLIEELQNLIVRQFQLKKTATLLADPGGDDGEERRGPDLCPERIERFRKASSEQFGIIEGLSFALLEHAYALRMLPINLVTGTLPRMAEETAIALGKDINLVITGAETVLDRHILEHLKDPLIHMLRNSIDHGIEPPAERTRRGKAATGTVTIACANTGQHIRIVMSDDGRGIDYEKLRARVIEMNPQDRDAIAGLDSDGLVPWLFTPGLSTSETVSEISGRGVGLDIVKRNLEIIKGKIAIKSETDAGTSFEITLPLSLATISGFFAKIGGMHCFLPGDYIDEIILNRNTHNVSLHNMDGIRYRDRVIPRYRPAWLIHTAGYEEKPDSSTLVVSLFGETVALSVEWIDDYSSRIVKALPPCLRDSEGLQGVVFDDNFEMVPVLNIPECVARLKRLRDIDRHQRAFASRKWYQQILVVDDSPSTREIECSILAGAGYRPEPAVDGIDALEKLRLKKYSLVLTDVEMPRMDGLTLLGNLRRDTDNADIPVIVLSNHDTPEFIAQAKEAGATKVVAKASFDRNRLLTIVRGLIGTAEKTYDE